MAVYSNLYIQVIESGCNVGCLETEMVRCITNKDPIAHSVNQLKNERNRLYHLTDISADIGITPHVVKIQTDYLQTKIQLCLQNVFSHFTQQIDHEFKATMSALNAFRETHSQSAHGKAKTAFNRFIKLYAEYQELGESCELNDNEKRHFLCAHNALEFLKWQFNPSVFVQLQYDAHFAVEDADKKEEWIESMQPQLNSLSKEHQDLIDQHVFMLGNGPSDATEWGKEHRFDDMKRFSVALYKATHELCLKLLNEEAGIKTEWELSQFYKKLHAVVNGPNTEAPEVWGKRELPYFYDFLGTVIDRLKKEKGALFRVP